MALQPAPLSRSERRKARTVAAILDAAERHFLERGLQDAKVDQIAEDADVGVGSIYNHFGSKERLYRALVERALDLFELYMEDEVEPDLPALERVLDIGGRFARFGLEQPGPLRMLALPPPARPAEELAEVGGRVARVMADHERRTAAAIEAGRRRGEIRPVNARHAAAFLWSSWKGMLALADPRDETRLRGAIETGLRTVVGGLASDAARGSNELVRAILESVPSPERREGEPRPGLHRAPVATDVRRELPELALWTAEVEAPTGPSPKALQQRLATLGDRLTGAHAVGARTESTPWAYRVLFRQLGIDPDEARTPVERLALRGADASSVEPSGLPDDALLLAVLETGVPVVGFDADRLDGELWLRRAKPGERVGDAAALPEGRIVIADRARPVAALFGEAATDAVVSPATERMALAAIQVKGVPDLAVEEALWTVVEILRAAR